MLENKRLPNFKGEREEIKSFEALVTIHNHWCEKRRRQAEEREHRVKEQERARAEARAKEQERLREETVAKEHWAKIHQSMRIAEISAMAGLEFERYLRVLFASHGYEVDLTAASGDQGADLVLRHGKDGAQRIAVQAKRHAKPVGNSAVQELLGGMTYYSCVKGIVVSSSGFTPAARDLASKAKSIELWDLDELQRRLPIAFHDSVPDFSWDEYRKLCAQVNVDLVKRSVSPEWPRQRSRKRWRR